MEPEVETLQQRRRRLTRASVQRSRRAQDDCQREQHRQSDRRRRRAIRQRESDDRRLQRLAASRQGRVERLAVESGEERERRLSDLRQRAAVRRSQERARSTVTSREHYLYGNGWAHAQHHHHEQPWAVDAMRSFHDKQNKWEHRLCNICYETWPTNTCLRDDQATFVCTRCKRDKEDPKRFSADNDMHPGEVPPCLRGLSQVEEMLLARACPIMSVYRKHGGQRGYKGHVLNLPQDVQGFLDRLPCNVSELPVLLLRRSGEGNTYTDLRVRRERVLTALQWLQCNNPFYANITIDLVAVSNLPDDSVPPELTAIDDDTEGEGGDDDSDDASAHISSTHSFLPLPRRAATENDAIRAAINGQEVLEWPTIANQPINEFKTPGLATQAFPTLFPYGTGDPTVPGRQRHVTLTDAFKHLMRYADKVEGTIHWRFASHPRFPYWALNMKQCHQLISQSSVYLQQHPADAQLTVEDLRDMVGRLSAEQLMYRLQHYAAKVQGSSQYWYKCYQELRALIEQKGPPTFFWTVSSADNYWPELHNLMPHPITTEPTHSMRVQAVINNPHLTDWYFTSKLSDWVQHWLYETLGAAWHWYRYEYQARGSTHAHGCAKLGNDPGICSLVTKAAAAWALSEDQATNAVSHTCPQLESTERARITHEGEEAKALVLRYCDWLVTTCNEAMPDELWRPPLPHPCTVSPNDITDLDEDYLSLINTVQRHTQCNAAYCLRRKHSEQSPTCRFNYPRPLQAESTLTFERLSDGTIRATLTTRRNDPRVNSHNRLMLQHWRANVDLQIIVDVQACARYMAKYAAKGEPRSQSVAAIFASSVGCLQNTSDAKSALRRAMIRAVGERDFSAQETAHMLLSLPLISCTYSFVTLSLTGSRHVTKDQQTGELQLQESLLEHYATRSSHLNISLLQFASEYSIYKGDIRKRSSPVIVRSIPNYSSNPCGENYGLYCKFQLVKHRPWQGEMSVAWGGGECSDEVCIAEYHSFLQTDTARESIPHFNQDLLLAQQHLADEEDDDMDDDQMQQSEQQDEWMQLCQLLPRFDMPSEADSHTDWATSARNLPPDILRDCPKWITTQRTVSNSASNSPWHRELPAVDSSSLNPKQFLAYDSIQNHYRQLTSGDSPPPLLMIISGTAGSGKSYLISAIAHLLADTCLLTGTTGMASFNICGKTLHSALQLPVRHTKQHSLQGSALQRLQLTLRGKHYLIIDEMSMMGQHMMAWVDKRLRQASARLELPLGGYSVILVGDFGQLPPVGDRPLFAPPSSNDLSIHGHHIYMMFGTVVLLEQVLRQRGTDAAAESFRQLLMRLRNGNVTLNDWHELLQRDPVKADNRTEFSDAIRLFYDKASVAQYNLEKLQALGTPIARINALHSNAVAAATKADDANGLHPVLFLAAGARVMITANLWQEVGLCNGAAGTVYQLLYQDDHHPPDLPIAILIDLDMYAGPPFLADRPKCVPIPPITCEWTTGIHKLSRQQLPLQLRYAITIHKCQGQTLHKAVIDIGKSELAAGCTFVAISRLPSLTSALIQPMPFDRLKAISTGRNFTLRLKEEDRLLKLEDENKE